MNKIDGQYEAKSHCCQRRDSTDGKAAALYPVDPGSNPDISMLQRALRLSVSAGRQTQLIMKRSWSRTLLFFFAYFSIFSMQGLPTYIIV